MLCIAQCFKTIVASSQGSGGVREWGCGGVEEWGSGREGEWGCRGDGEWGSGGVGNYVPWMCRKEVPWWGGRRETGISRHLYFPVSSLTRLVCLLSVFALFIPTPYSHLACFSEKREREQVFQVIQLIVFLFTGYVIGQFSLHPTMLFHSKIIFKARKRKPTTTTHRRYSFTLAQ